VIRSNDLNALCDRPRNAARRGTHGTSRARTRGLSGGDAGWPTVCASSSASSRFRPESQPRESGSRYRGSINEGASSGTHWRTRPEPVRRIRAAASRVVGDGEGRDRRPLATSWAPNKFPNPVHDGRRAPILHLKAQGIRQHAVWRVSPERELNRVLEGTDTIRTSVAGTEPRGAVHQEMASALRRWPCARSRHPARRGEEHDPHAPPASGLMIVAAHADRLDGTEGASTASRSRARSARTSADHGSAHGTLHTARVSRVVGCRGLTPGGALDESGHLRAG